MSFRNSKRRSSQTALLDSKGRAEISCRVKTMSLLPLEEMVTCPIDLNFLEDPRLLPCGHVFCCQCLNNYLRQLTSPNKNSSIGDETVLPCPICRMQCSIPQNGQAESLPKAFNHTLILDYVRTQTMNELSTNSQQENLEQANSSRVSVVSNTSPMGRRKGSIYVKSDMLQDLADDISKMQRSGSNTFIERALILEEVRKLINKMSGASTQPNQKDFFLVEPSAPPLPPSPPKVQQVIKKYSVPTELTHGGRFQTAAALVLGCNTPPNMCSYRRPTREISNEDKNDCVINRDVEEAHLFMKRNSMYTFLKKNHGCCDFPKGTVKIVDMHFSPILNSKNVMRLTINCDGTDNILHLWRKTIIMDPQQNSFLFNNNKSPIKSQNTIVYQKVQIDLPDMGKLQVQYLRFYKNRVYMTVIALQELNSSLSIDGDANVSMGVTDPGLVVCCSLPDLPLKVSKDQLNNNVSQDLSNDLVNFPIVSKSDLFFRDGVGLSNLNKSTIAGFDIDRSSGEIYVALCANAMICRLSSDMSKVEREWFLNDPHLSPSYLCLAKSENEVWASCPLDDKVFILNLSNGNFHHFTPSASFGIIPSHIICASDEKILLLDKKFSRVFWFQKVHQIMCTQRIDHSLKERRKRGIEIIQPIDDLAISKLIPASNKRSSRGGIICADDNGSYIVYPKHITTMQTITLCCKN